MLIALLSFLIGSVPIGILLAKAYGLPDPRSIGSGNIGATNMLRTGRKDVAILTLLLDAGKGVGAVLLAHGINDAFLFWAAFFVVLGHCYCPWLNFKGGKGVATALGMILALDAVLPPFGNMTVPLMVTWFGIFILRRYVSLASITTAAFFPIVAMVTHGAIVAPGLTAALIVWRHRANIARLRAGTEPKMGSKKHA